MLVFEEMHEISSAICHRSFYWPCSAAWQSEFWWSSAYTAYVTLVFSCRLICQSRGVLVWRRRLASVATSLIAATLRTRLFPLNCQSKFATQQVRYSFLCRWFSFVTHWRYIRLQVTSVFGCHLCIVLAAAMQHHLLFQPFNETINFKGTI